MAQEDEYGHHEVIHLSSIIAGLWEDEILNHGAVQQSPEMKEQATEILRRLANFYQLAAQVRWDKFPIK